MLKLERMELSGFKSFQERTEIRFDQGVTAVVGPNGCGKSNILDAMSWVLGEQSVKTLRGSSMVDLIFNGSQNRRPLGMAEVTLRLRATNGDLPNGDAQVALTRKLFRSGEAVYELNGNPCRLKDIQNILYGSGLGVKAYSFIEQGRIGAVLSARPLDRRALVEEAAGITRFRVKKREAELKLEAAEQNLLRVRDIIAEIDKQMGSLKRQAAKARRFGRTRDELRGTLSELYLRDHRALLERTHEAGERWQVATARRSELSLGVGKAECEIDELRLAIDKQESELRSASERLHEVQLEVDRNRNLIVSGRERLAEFESRTREIGENLALSRSRQGDLDRELAMGESARAALVSRETEAGLLLARERTAREVSEDTVRQVESALEELSERKLETVRNLADVGNAAGSCRRLVAELRDRRERLTTEEVVLEAEERGAVLSSLAMRDELATLEAQATELANNVRVGFAEAQLLSERRGDLQSRFDVARQELQQSEERARALARITGAAEDAGAATAAAATLLGAAARGLVADGVRSDPRFERAVGAALEGILGALVVDDPLAALEALTTAATAEGGAIRILLTGETDSSELDLSDLLARDGVIASLDQFVEVDTGLVSTLIPRLRRVVLVERIDAFLLALYPTLMFVTVDGVVAGPEGLLRGGAADSGFLGLRRELRELEATLEGRRLEVESASTVLQSVIAEVEGADGAARAAVDCLHDAEKELLGGRHRSETADEARRKKRDLLRAVILEGEAVEREIGEAEGELEERDRVLAETEQDRIAIDADIVQRRRELEGVRLAAVERSRALLAAEGEFARAEESSKAAAAHSVRLQGSLAERATEIAMLVADRDATQDRGRSLQADVEQAEEALTGLFADVAALEDRQRTEESGVRQGRHELHTQDTALRDLRLQAERQRESLQAIEIERTRLESELSRLAERAAEDLGCALEALALDQRPVSDGPSLSALDEDLGIDRDEESGEGESGGTVEASGRPRASAAVGELSIDELRARVELLRGRLLKLGPVNELAVQEFQELRGRFEFLSAQVGDLTESIEALTHTIQRINRTSRERFAETFEAVNRNFQETFVRLFGGGRAELRLTDEENLLETGIDIVAQPPGKRLQNILLLSGGEKALTAISLLFALFQYKPSPFCILDEVDAPLDEKNIDRFAGLLKTLSEGTQFILITHSPRTMRVADTLYGVTMEEPGVSRLVSVNLREMEH